MGSFLLKSMDETRQAAADAATGDEGERADLRVAFE
jgi:hypothetical protein